MGEATRKELRTHSTFSRQFPRVRAEEEPRDVVLRPERGHVSSPFAMSQPAPALPGPIHAELTRLAQRRILIIDGAMGTSIQGFHLTEADYRGQAFASAEKDLKGNNELLCITRPDVITQIHEGFLEAGADIIETNTFNANAISQSEYGLSSAAYDLNVAAAKLALAAAHKYSELTPDKPRYVAGALGPLNRTLSMSPNVDDPGYRAVSYEQVKAAYAEQVNALLDVGVHILLPETVFDTLNLKVALQAIEEVQAARGTNLPV